MHSLLSGHIGAGKKNAVLKIPQIAVMFWRRFAFCSARRNRCEIMFCTAVVDQVIYARYSSIDDSKAGTRTRQEERNALNPF